MVCVDDLMPVIKVTGRWKWPESCHLYSDDNNLQELHEFAAKLKLQRNWFQEKSFPHYDLTKGMREKAVRMGAKEVTFKEMAEDIRKRRMCLQIGCSGTDEKCPGNPNCEIIAKINKRR